ncbi:MAG: glutamate dehydrogenase [Flavobacteriaceae bacterium]|nr:MAG: glutamate dehydrogenase [Flavobacteriaceae bacterium]
MVLILHFILGFITSFLGTLTPSMLNMTAAKISINKSKSDAVKFAIGVSMVVLLQAYIAILFTKFLHGNPDFVQALQKIAMVIFALLSFYFYRQFKKDKAPIETVKEKAGNSFVVGLVLSALNMFSIPFYCGVTTALDVAGWLQFTQQNILIFVLGSALGTFSLLYMYANFAKVIQLKSKGLAKNLNLILSILTGVLAVITFVKIF